MWLVYAVGAAAIWGLNYSLNERIFQGRVAPASLLVFQGLAGAALALLFAGRRLPTDLAVLRADRATLGFALLAMLSYAAANLLISLSIQAKDATLAGLIELSYPIFTVLFSWLLFRQLHLTPTSVLGAVLIMAGVVLIAVS